MSRPLPARPRILVLGIGNLLWADEGFGVRAAEALAAGWDLPEDVQVMDGGTQGLYLLHHVEEADVLIVFDAVDYGLAPGSIHIVRDEEAPSFLGAKKMSLHQTGFQDVIATAELRGRRPPRILLIGVQPVELEDYGGGLRPEVADCIPLAVGIALDELRDVYGIRATRRAAPGAGLADAAISREAYEGGRPSEEEAWRKGDDRFARRAAAVAASAHIDAAE